MGVCKGKDTRYHACIIAVGILVTAAFSPPLVWGSATLNYTTTTGCPGEHVIVTCLTLSTDLLKWIIMDQGEIGFRSSNVVSYQRPLSGTPIVATLTMKSCSNNTTLCSLESLIDVPIWSEMGNFTLACQSSKNESERIAITTSDQCNETDILEDPTINSTTIAEVSAVTYTPEPLPGNNSSGAFIQASLGVLLTPVLVTVIYNVMWANLSPNFLFFYLV